MCLQKECNFSATTHKQQIRTVREEGCRWNEAYKSHHSLAF